MDTQLFASVIQCFMTDHTRCWFGFFDYYLWGAVKDKYYADKPETTIDALNDNIREAVGEIIYLFYLLITIQLQIIF